jgi:hypothetical protein
MTAFEGRGVGELSLGVKSGRPGGCRALTFILKLRISNGT